jgi:hypothetical protein
MVKTIVPEVYTSTLPIAFAELRQCYSELHVDGVVRRMPLWIDLDPLRESGRSKLFFAVRPCLQQPGCFAMQCWRGGGISCIPNLSRMGLLID